MQWMHPAKKNNSHPRIPSLFRAGFTLVEVMVSVSIFTIVVTIGIGSLLMINKANAQSRADREATDKISYLMEHLTRKLQTAILVEDDSTSQRLSFINQLGDREIYDFDPGSKVLLYTYEECEKNTSVACSSVIASESFPITPEGSLVAIDEVAFFIEGNALDSIQPSVRIVMRGSARERQEMSPFAVQTTISLRVLQFP